MRRLGDMETAELNPDTRRTRDYGVPSTADYEVAAPAQGVRGSLPQRHEK